MRNVDGTDIILENSARLRLGGLAPARPMNNSLRMRNCARKKTYSASDLEDAIAEMQEGEATSMRMAFAPYSARSFNNSMVCCSVLVHVLFSAMLSCSFSPVDLIHPWRTRKSSQQGARDVPILLAGCYFARKCMFGNPRPLEFLT